MAKTIKMKKADWNKWDLALRSGRYRQGRETLYDKRDCSFCCLGVLQVVLDGKVEILACENRDEADGVDYGEPINLPTSGWLRSHGITFQPTSASEANNNPHLPMLKTSAAQANDIGVNFVEIANAIAETVEFTD